MVIALNKAALILALFLLTQLLGLYVGINLIQAVQANPELQDFNVAPGGESGSPASSAIFLIYVLAGAVAMVLILKFYKGVLLFKLIEAGTLFVASNIIFYVLFLSFSVPLDWLWSIILSGTLTLLKFFRPEAKNLAAVLSAAGVGAVFGFSLDILPAVLFVAGLSLYDFLSVFWTGHMVYMAKELGKRNLAFSVVATTTEYSGRRRKPERTTLELGTGDLAIPLMLAVSSYKISFNVIDPLFVILGSSVGLLAVLWYVTHRRTFLPALPPISFAALLFLALAKLFITR